MMSVAQAGLAIAERLTATLRARGAIGRGLNEAIGRVQQADDGLGRIAELLQQGRELALAAANGSLGDSDRAGLQQGLRTLIDQKTPWPPARGCSATAC